MTAVNHPVSPCRLGEHRVLMSATLIAKELSAGHGDQLLFSGLDLVVAPGDVIGLVGANGAGKTTLRLRHT
jgi:ABC-type transporter Mla maintaining outer membrane lipid asymmetry ATPase subunit MlaF